MIWKKMTHRQKSLLFVVVLALCSILPLFCSYSVSASSISNILNFQTNWYANQETTLRQTNRSGSIPLDFLSTQTTYNAIRVPSFSFSFNSPDQSSGKFYNIKIVFDIKGDYIHYIANPPYTSLTGSARFEQGTVENFSDSVSYQTMVYNNVTRYTVTSQVSLNSSVPLSTVVVSLNSSGGYLLNCSGNGTNMTYPCQKPYTATIMNIVDFEVTISDDPSVGLLQQQIQQNQQIIDQNQQQIDQDNQDRNQLENSSEEAQESGESAGDNASDVGQSLFGAFTSLLTAIMSIHPTDCMLPDFEVNGLEFTDMDMCSVSVPTGISALGSLMLVFMIVPMGINCAKRMLSLYNELLGGK